MKTCTGSFLKLAVFAFNGLFVLFSVLVLVYSGIMISSINSFHKFNLPTAPFIVLAVVGSFLLVLTFMACCGAVMENQCMLNTFAYVVGAIVIVELVAGALAYRFRDRVEDNIKKAGQKLINDYEKDNTTREFVDEFQSTFHCCGVNSTADWDDYRSRHHAGSAEAFPDSCCYVNREKPGQACIIPDFQDPCIKPLVNEVTGKSTSLLIVVGCFVGVQVLSMLLACCLATSVRREYHQFV